MNTRHGISFNSRLGLLSFTEPISFPTYFSAVPGAGIYVILAPDITWRPRQFRPIYFEVTSDFSARVSVAHERFEDWRQESSQLYLAQSFMTGSSKQSLLDIESALIDWYAPPCNATGFAAALAYYGRPYLPAVATAPESVLPQATPYVSPFLALAVPPGTYFQPNVPLAPAFRGPGRITTTPGPVSPRTTYVIFDGDSDMYAYRFMRGWKAREHVQFDFADAHELGSELTDRASEETVKRRLRERSSSAEQAIVLIGPNTKNLYRFVRWEIQVALDLKLPIIAVNLNGKCDYDADLCPPILRNEYVVHVPFKMKAIKLAMDSFPREHARQAAIESGPRAYSVQQYQNIGLPISASGYAS